MELTRKAQKAYDFAEKIHEGQVRKGSTTPYFTHPRAVGYLLAEYTDDEEVICAGFLHDVLEDTEGYDRNDMAGDFGPRVADIVNHVSHQDEKKLTKEEKRKLWKKRKQNYIDHLESAPFEALMVSAADKIHNLETMGEKYREEGESMWKIFNAPEPQKENVIWFYTEVLNKLKKRLDNPIVIRLQRAVSGFAIPTGGGR